MCYLRIFLIISFPYATALNKRIRDISHMHKKAMCRLYDNQVKCKALSALFLVEKHTIFMT